MECAVHIMEIAATGVSPEGRDTMLKTIANAPQGDNVRGWLDKVVTGGMLCLCWCNMF